VEEDDWAAPADIGPGVGTGVDAGAGDEDECIRSKADGRIVLLPNNI